VIISVAVEQDLQASRQSLELRARMCRSCSGRPMAPARAGRPS